MKKLCSLLTCAGLMLSMATIASADVDKDFNEVVHPTVTTAKMHTTLTGDLFTTTVVGVGTQATLLVVKGDNVTADSETIQGIDQNGTMVFEYRLRDTSFEANQKYTIKVGGSDLGSPISQVIIPNESSAPTGYTISGTVENRILPQDTGEGEEYDLELDEAFKTTVSVYTDFDLDNGEPLSPLLDAEENAVVVTVDAGNGRFSIPNLDDGNYYLVVERVGNLKYFAYVEVAGDDIDVGDMSLIAGDVDDDMFVYGNDSESVYPHIGSTYWNFGEDGYQYAYDTDGDAFIYGNDFESIYSKIGYTCFGSYTGEYSLYK